MNSYQRGVESQVAKYVMDKQITEDTVFAAARLKKEQMQLDKWELFHG